MKKVLFGLICLLVLIPNVKANEFDDFKKAVVVDDTIEMPAIKPKKEIEAYRYFWTFLDEKDLDNVLISNISEDFSEISIRIHDEEYKTIGEGTFKLNWAQEDPSITKIIDSYREKIAKNAPTYKFGENSGYLYVMDDMDAVSLYFNAKDQYEPMYKILTYFKEFNDLFDDEKFSYYCYPLISDSNNVMAQSYGEIIFKYDGIYYGIFEDIGGNATRAIYIPDETENTPDAYIEAASKRLKESFPDETFKIQKGGKLTDEKFNLKLVEFRLDLNEELGNPEKSGDYYYKITNGDKTYDFLIIRDSSKLLFEKRDEETSVTVTTTSLEVPFDTVLKVEKVLEKSDTYKKIYNVLKFNEADIYDITLYSESLEKNITKLEDVEFTVTVPIKETLRDKDLVAYYIDENNKIEEHPVVVDKNGMGTFTTNHFSTYTIAEKNKAVVTPVENVEPVPKTYDGITNYIILGIISIVSLSFVTLYIKKQGN